MALRSCLDERTAPVVADTSVVINLNATGDGEAILGALPNCARERSAIALIDDRKAIRICADRFPELAVGCTVDVLAQRHVQAALDRRLADAVFNALDPLRVRDLNRRFRRSRRASPRSDDRRDRYPTRVD